LQILDDGGGELTGHRSINRNPRGAKAQIAGSTLGSGKHGVETTIAKGDTDE
jgi:hypothetical protein